MRVGRPALCERHHEEERGPQDALLGNHRVRPGETLAEHFPDPASHTASLIERAEHFFTAPGRHPEIVLADEQRRAALVATLLVPATVTLSESVLNEDEGVYCPDSSVLPIR